MFEKNLVYTVNYKEETLWFCVNNEHLAMVHNINENQIEIIHTIVAEHREAPYNKIIVLPESFTGNIIEMSAIEHEIGHILLGHDTMSEDEAQIQRELEADKYVVNKMILGQIVSYLLQILMTEEAAKLKNIDYLRNCNLRRLEAIQKRNFNFATCF